MSRLLDASRESAAARGRGSAAAAGGRMERTLQPAVRRLQELARVNPAVTAEEIGTAREELAALTSGLDGVRVRLAAVRLVLVGG